MSRATLGFEKCVVWYLAYWRWYVGVVDVRVKIWCRDMYCEFRSAGGSV
jgi:hypothetical protein